MLLKVECNVSVLIMSSTSLWQSSRSSNLVTVGQASHSAGSSFRQRAPAVLLDIPKAFDRVWRNGLLHRLNGYVVCCRIFALIQSRLIQQHNKICFNGFSLNR